MEHEAQDSQQEPQQDSELQTPQPDQPVVSQEQIDQSEDLESRTQEQVDEAQDEVDEGHAQAQQASTDSE